LQFKGQAFCTAGGNQKLGPMVTKHAADRDASPSRRCAGQPGTHAHRPKKSLPLMATFKENLSIATASSVRPQGRDRVAVVIS
jgi:hypothetical protein